jgi:hypothetical protein
MNWEVSTPRSRWVPVGTFQGPIREAPLLRDLAFIFGRGRVSRAEAQALFGFACRTRSSRSSTAHLACASFCASPAQHHIRVGPVLRIEERLPIATSGLALAISPSCMPVSPSRTSTRTVFEHRSHDRGHARPSRLHCRSRSQAPRASAGCGQGIDEHGAWLMPGSHDRPPRA